MLNDWRDELTSCCGQNLKKITTNTIFKKSDRWARKEKKLMISADCTFKGFDICSNPLWAFKWWIHSTIKCSTEKISYATNHKAVNDFLGIFFLIFKFQSFSSFFFIVLQRKKTDWRRKKQIMSSIVFSS